MNSLQKLLVNLRKKEEINIAEINAVFSMIKVMNEKVPRSGEEFQDIIHVFRQFLELVHRYMLLQRHSSDPDMLTQLHQVAYTLVTGTVRSIHRPIGASPRSVAILDSLLSDLTQEEEELIIETDRSKEAPIYDPGILNLPDDLQGFREELLELIHHEDLVVFPLSRIRDEPRDRRNIILSILSNLEHGKGLHIEGECFVVRTETENEIVSKVIGVRLDNPDLPPE